MSCMITYVDEYSCMLLYVYCIVCEQTSCNTCNINDAAQPNNDYGTTVPPVIAILLTMYAYANTVC